MATSSRWNQGGRVFVHRYLTECKVNANTVPRYNACPFACALVRMDNLIRRHVCGMDNAGRQAENVVTIEGGIKEGYLLIDNQQDSKAT